ncbi:putative bifunctional diguanylate cyclase/phosphodiesterase [Notoacmeibacter ruber]|uniref:EAL domain-containing protein n=1 Tax=Notoacmeibacter ruber TaxID=2670375 RepID=A0A3L7JFB3_9HYPH|nr:EAL domain-containing protein [Notoacmeibacter ruber]RLQ89376.1 EAL domain-containing protein [Notoacmeibacter ruber]
MMLAGFLLFSAMPLHAQEETVQVEADDLALDLSRAVEITSNGSRTFQVSAAPGEDGIVRRIEVEALGNPPSGHWAVLSLANASEQQIDRQIVAPHYRLVGSGLWKPDLGAQRIVNITPSEGFALDSQPSEDADIFNLTLNPNSVVTLVIELATPELPQLYIWEPEAYKDTINAYTLFRGIVIGISGLLALFLTILFVVRGTVMFPAAAALAWAVLFYISVDFGFLDRMVGVATGSEPVWRATAEIALAGTLVIFLFAYLNLSRWHKHFSHAALVWLTALGCLVALAVFYPSFSAGVARISLALTAVVGLGVIVWQASHRYDRAIMLVPSWVAVAAWVVGMGMTISGAIDNDVVQPALGGGLVLIVLLIGFTVMQHAFSGGAVRQGLFSDVERQALAMTGSGDIVFDWDVLRDRIVTRPDIAPLIGLRRQELRGPARDWVEAMHLDDRDHFRTTLDMILEHRRGRIRQDFRLRGEDGHYHWYSLKARPVVGADGEVVRCVGTICEVTEQKKAEERLLYDSVHDNMTGLPNRELFMDRLGSLVATAREDERIRPTVLAIDIDRFRTVNESLGISVGDTILLTVARRLARLCRSEDTLSRFSGDHFMISLGGRPDPSEVKAFTAQVKKTISAPINFANQEIVLTPSIGVAGWTQQHGSAQELVKDAELALHQAKRFGGDRVEPFRPAFRTMGSDYLHIEADLHRAIDNGELHVLYQPIIRIASMTIAGFEALIRWNHPKRGPIAPADFVPIAENSGLIARLGLFVMQRAADDMAAIARHCDRDDLYVAVNLSSSQFLRQDLVSDVKSVLTRTGLKPSTFRLELTETMVMKNPEQNARVLEQLDALGIGLSIDDFGTGYSALSYLTRFPFDCIKIDRSFVIDRTDQSKALLRSLVHLGHEVGMSIVVEGVDDDDTLALLQEAGCDYVQSFMFGKPVDMATAQEYCAQERAAAAQ